MIDNTETIITKIIKVLMKVPQYQDQVCFDILDLTDQDFIIKWKSDYDRIMQLKAFL